MVLYELKPNRRDDKMSLSAGEVTRFSEKCEAFAAELTAEQEKGALTAVSVHQIIVRLTWHFFYARKGAAPAEYQQILAVYLATLERLHELWLDVEPANVVKETIVTVREKALAWDQNPRLSLPRDPEQAAIYLSPEDV